jgi:large subunit ribosomal protein L30
MQEYIIPMAKIRITQVRSRIHCTKRQKLNLDALGLRKMNASVEHEATPQILGMVEKARHLVKITDI